MKGSKSETQFKSVSLARFRRMFIPLNYHLSSTTHIGLYTIPTIPLQLLVYHNVIEDAPNGTAEENKSKRLILEFLYVINLQ
jgi:hypothetical protein